MSWFANFLNWFRPAPRYQSQVLPIEPFDPTHLAYLHNVERARSKVVPPLVPLLVDPKLGVYATVRAGRAASLNLAREHLHDGFAPPVEFHVPAGENAEMGSAGSAGVMAAWMDSPGHRANILKPAYTRMGCGRSISKDGVTYWYTVFAG